MKRLLVLSLFVLLIQGCSYAISRDTMSRVDKEVTFEMVQSQPDALKGKILVLGGTIVQTTDTRQGSVIEVVERPLDYWGKPKRTSAGGGRFLLQLTGHVSAMLYAPGREITAAAEVKGTRSKAAGETDYSYPVFLAKELKLWPSGRKGWDTPQWFDPLNSPLGPPASPPREHQ